MLTPGAALARVKTVPNVKANETRSKTTFLRTPGARRKIVKGSAKRDVVRRGENINPFRIGNARSAGPRGPRPVA